MLASQILKKGNFKCLSSGIIFIIQVQPLYQGRHLVLSKRSMDPLIFHAHACKTTCNALILKNNLLYKKMRGWFLDYRLRQKSKSIVVRSKIKLEKFLVYVYWVGQNYDAWTRRCCPWWCTAKIEQGKKGLSGRASKKTKTWDHCFVHQTLLAQET